MLVLTRKTDEQIVIGDDIKITLIRVRGNTVRLGIEAPRDVRILRGELEPEEGDDDEAPEDREEAFAHPTDNRHIHSTVSSGRPSGTESAGADRKSVNRIAAPHSPKVYVGRVRRDGSRPELSRTPLSAFVSAS